VSDKSYGVKAEVICHSRNPSGDELFTLEIQMHRFILPEFNTHRCFSRNFQSSRAVPVEKMIKQVRDHPAMPVFWGANEKGMVAWKQLGVKDKELANNLWVVAANEAADRAECLTMLGTHKQLVNRLLEPFMWTRGVVTATKEGLDSFFSLRCHSDAQPEIKALADAMKDAVHRSTAKELYWGELHLPYVEIEHCPASGPIYGRKGDKCLGGVENAIKVSVSCAAQVSYRMLDDSLEKATRIYNMLKLPSEGIYKEDPPHFSPTEHVAMADSFGNAVDGICGNFSSGWWQYRKALETGDEQDFTTGESCRE